jgi:hypothetical protein
MKKLNLFFLMTLIGSLGFLKAAPVMPEISQPDGPPVWYYIEFSQRAWPANSGNRYLYDPGDEQAVVAVPAVNEADGILWKIEETDTDGQYRIVSNRGNSIAYTSYAIVGTDIDRYYSSSTTTDRYKIEEVNTDYYKLTRVGGNGIDKSNNSPYFDAYGGGDGVSITFKAAGSLTDLPTEPTIAAIDNSTSLAFGDVTVGYASEPKFLFAYNLTGDLTYSLQGSDKYSVTPESPIAKSGDGTACVLLKIVARPTETGASNATLEVVSTGATFLPIALTAAGKALNIPVELSPTVENSDADKWYYINYTKRHGVALHDLGAGQDLIGVLPVENEEGQLWKVVSTGISDKYKIISKRGNGITRTSGNFASTAASGYNFRFDARSDGKWQIYCQETGGHINKNNPNPNFGSYNANPDHGNAVEFVKPEDMTFDDALQFSTDDEEYWYQIKFNGNASKTLQDNGPDQEISQETPVDGQTNQYWKITGTTMNCQLESYDGYQIAKLVGGASADQHYKTVAKGSGESHGLIKYTGGGTLSAYWQLRNNVMDRDGTSDKNTRYLNNQGGTRVNLFNSDDQGNALVFTTLTAPPAEFSVTTTNLSFEIVPVDMTENLSATVVARNLSGTITCEITGDDASVFTVDLEKSVWSEKRGGELSIAFTPTTVKEYSATLTIKTDGQTEVEIPLSGTGSSDPVIIVTPATLAFGDVTTGLASDTKAIAVLIRYTEENIAYEKKGEDKDAFTVTESSWTAEAGGTLTVVFNPTATEDYSASIEFTSEGADTKTVTLTGTGVTTELPVTLSTDDNKVWYYIEVNKRSGQYYYDSGADKALEISPAFPDEDGLLWKVVSTGISGKYQLISKAGHQIAYTATASGDIAANRFYTTATDANTYRFDKRDDNNWQIYSNDAESYINKNETGSNLANTQFGEYDELPDDGSSVIFIPEAAIEYRLPVFSTEEETAWYYLSFQKHSANNIQGNGENADVTQVVKSETNVNQLWKFTGTWDDAKIVNPQGLELKLVGSFYQLVADGTGNTYKLFWNTAANETGWRLINNSATGENVLVNDNNGSKLGPWRQDGNPGNALDIVQVAPPFDFDFVIEASAEASATAYNPDLFGDIIFKSNDVATAQLKDIPADGLTVNGVVKVEKTVTLGKQYPIGFPFAIADVSDETYALQSYDGATNLFGTATDIEAYKGYLIQFPQAEPAEGEAAATTVTVTFTSEANPVLLNATIASVADGYSLVANPLFTNVAEPIGGAEAFYVYDSATEAFVLLGEEAVFALKPFEALVAVKGVTNLYDNIGDGIDVGLGNIDANDPVVDIKYYTLQGYELQRLSQNGIYLVKKIHASQKAEVSKVLYKK